MRSPQVVLVPKATMEIQFLPKCPACGCKHPKAFRPPLPADTCPSCGKSPGDGGEPQVLEAPLTGLGGRLVAFGSWLNSLRSKF